MACKQCDRPTPPDHKTGYQGDMLCPECKAQQQQAVCVQCGAIIDYPFTEPRPDYCSGECEREGEAWKQAARSMITAVEWLDADRNNEDEAYERDREEQ